MFAPQNGSIVCSGDQITDHNCLFSCDYGFDINGPVIRFCQANNTWTDEHPFCTIKHCINLQRPANAYVATKSCPTEFTSKCEIQCVDGYYIVDDDTPFYQTCEVNTTNKLYWSRPPVCECEYNSFLLSILCSHYSSTCCLRCSLSCT